MALSAIVFRESDIAVARDEAEGLGSAGLRLAGWGGRWGKGGRGGPTASQQRLPTDHQIHAGLGPSDV